MVAGAALLEHERADVGWDRWRRSAGSSMTPWPWSPSGGASATSLAVEIGRLVEQVETARAMVDDSAAYLSRGEGYPPSMTHLLKLTRHGRRQEARGAGV